MFVERALPPPFTSPSPHGAHRMAEELDTRAALRALWQRIAERPEADVRERMRAHGFLEEPSTDAPPARAPTAPSPPGPTTALSNGSGCGHLGVGVSDRLAHVHSDEAALRGLGLPILHDAAGLARALGLTEPVLRWLTFHRRGAALVHYHCYDVPKKTGGARGISAPKRTLKAAQHWVLASVLAPLRVSETAHGFIPERSIVTNARPHVRRAVVVNMDLADFFPSIGFRRVRGLFAALGYSGEVSTVLALLCTEPPRVPVRVDGDPTAAVTFIALGDRRLPQGAPTSPALSNALCRRLDARLAGAARALGFSYTRYADDLTFSGDEPEHAKVLLARVRRIVQAEGFLENPAKTRVMRRGRRQEVTGVIVNEKLTVPRTEVRRLRAILHNASKTGLVSQNRENHPAFVRYLEGKIAFVKMVDPRRGAQLSLMLRRVLAASPDL
jgi:RNA-directed DNA polymerase